MPRPDASMPAGDPWRASIDAVAWALGRTHVEGPFTTPHRCVLTARLRQSELPTCHVADDETARCSRCGREFTRWYLIRIVLETPRLAWRLRVILAGDA